MMPMVIILDIIDKIKVDRERYRSHLSKCKQSKGVGLSNRTDQT